MIQARAIADRPLAIRIPGERSAPPSPIPSSPVTPIPAHRIAGGSAPARDTLATVERILAQLASTLGPGDVERFLRHQAALTLSGTRLEVRARTGFVAEAIRTKFARPLSDAARAELGAGAEVVIGVDGSAAPATAQPAQRLVQHAPHQHSPHPPHAASASRQPAKRARTYRLEDFLVGESNRLAYTAALTISDPESARNFSPLVLHGPCGVGKTHLLQAIAARFHERRPDAVIRCITAEAFTNDFVAAVRSGKVDAFRKAYRGLGLLCIDDIQFLSNKEATQQELLHTFDHIDLGGARVVLASDEHPRDVRQLSSSLVSRFMSGMVVKIDSPEPALRERITQSLAERRGVRLDQAAVALIASRCGAAGHSASVRDIEGALMRVDAYRSIAPELCEMDGGRIGLNLVRAALQIREDASRPRKPVKVQSICSSVCAELGVGLEEVYGRGRHARVVLARSMCAVLSRDLTTMSFPEIARAMGRPGHSSVVTACKRMGGQIKSGAHPERGAELPAPYSGLTLGAVFERLRDIIAGSAAGA